ncbi:MAG: ATP-binding protein [Candidatus Aminicenantes bacterium]
MDALTVPSEFAELKKIRSFLKETLHKYNLSEKEYFIIELSLLEVCINIIKYAYPKQRGEISIQTWPQQGKIFLEIRDHGTAFDPSKSEVPEVEDIIKNEKTGGLGIFLARKLMDGFHYKREKGQNILTMNKKITSSESV